MSMAQPEDREYFSEVPPAVYSRQQRIDELMARGIRVSGQLLPEDILTAPPPRSSTRPFYDVNVNIAPELRGLPISDWYVYEWYDYGHHWLLRGGDWQRDRIHGESIRSSIIDEVVEPLEKEPIADSDDDLEITEPRIHGVIKNNFAAIVDPNDERRKKQINAVNYIQFLSSTTGIDISEWDIREVFTGSKRQFYTDKKAINKAFFAEADRRKQDVGTMDLEFARIVDSQTKRISQSRLRRLKEQLDSHLQSASNLQSRLTESLRIISEKGREIRALDGREDGLMSGHIKNIIDSGRWKLGDDIEKVRSEASRDQITLYSTSDIVITEKNKLAGIDHTVNLGRFKVGIFYDSGLYIEVMRWKDNFAVSNHIHPHIGTGGDPCWGQAGDEIRRLYLDFNLTEVFKILDSILFDYNDSNPYVPIYSFIQYLESGGRRSDEQQPLQDSYFCESCDVTTVDTECPECGHEFESSDDHDDPGF